MPTKWVVTTPSSSIDLDEAQQGQTTFTVTNPSTRVDRVVFDIVPGDGADPSWFSVDEPQRRVPASGSVSYLMKTAIPTTAKAGAYSVQGRVYSADSAPEEDSVLSSRLAVEIRAKAAPIKKKRPWWILVVAALVVIVLVVVGILIFHNGSSGETVTVPDLSRQSESQAKTNLTVFGLTVGTVRHKQDATPDIVLYQSAAGGSKITKGSAVDLVVSVGLAAPTITAPASGATVSAKAVAPPTTPVPVTAGQPSPTPTTTGGTSGPVFRWTDSDAFVSHWQVTIEQQVCASYVAQRIQSCYFLSPIIARVDTSSYTPIINPVGTVNLSGLYVATQTPAFQWQVAAVDDFGNVGPASAFLPFTVQ